MPRKKRSAKRRHVIDLDVLNAGLTLESWVSHWGDEEEARAAWSALRQGWSSHLGERTPMFWAYEDGIPDELRVDVPDADPRLSKSDVTEDAHKLKRMRWLLNGGQDYLWPGETAVIVERLRELDG